MDTRPSRRLAWMAMAAAVAACGGADGGARPPDGGPGGDDVPSEPVIPWRTDGAPPVAAPDIPWAPGRPPVVAPNIPWLAEGVPPIDSACEGGWRGVTEDGVGICLPYPAAGRRACPDGEAHFPGTVDCAPVGRGCGAEVFPPTDDLPPETPRRYVRGGADAGGDGSEDAPYASLADALEGASPGTVLVIGAGTYVVGRPWPADVAARGRCARDTVLVANADATRSAVIVGDSGAASFRDLRVAPDGRGGIHAVGAASRLELAGVIIDGATGLGIRVAEGAQLVADDLLIRGSRAGRPGHRAGAIRVEAGSEATITRAELADNDVPTASSSGAASRLLLRDVAARGNRSRSDGSTGAAVNASDGGNVRLERVALDDNVGVGVAANGAGAVVEATSVVVRDTAPGPGGVLGVGAQAEVGGAVRLDRALILRSRRGAATSFGTGSRLELRDTLVASAPIGRPDGGPGISALDGAAAHLERVLVSRSRDFALLTNGRDGAEVDLTMVDVVIRDTVGVGVAGVGVLLGPRSSLHARRALFEGNWSVDLAVGDPDQGATAVLDDVVFRDPSPARIRGGAITAAASAVTLRRARLEGQRDPVVSGLDGGELNLEDVTVEATVAPENRSPVGLLASHLDAIRLTRAVLDANRVVASETDFIGMTDVVVQEAALAPSEGITAAIWLRNVPEARLERVVLTDNPNHLLLTGAGETVIEDALFRAASAEALVALDGPRLTARRVSLGDGGGGPLVAGAGTECTLVDVTVEAGPAGSGAARGIGVEDDATAILERVIVAGEWQLGIFADRGVVRAIDVMVRGSGGDGSRTDGGRGISIQSDSVATLERVLVTGGSEIGLFADGSATTLTAVDLVVEGTLPLSDGIGGGRGLSVQNGAFAALERTAVEGNQEVALFASRAMVDASDLGIRDTAAPPCAPDCSFGGSLGLGVGAYAGADVDITRFSFETNDTCGMHLTNGSQLDVADGAVRGHAIAICLQADDYDLARLRRTVRFEANGALVEATSFQIPELSGVAAPVEPVPPPFPFP